LGNIREIVEIIIQHTSPNEGPVYSLRVDENGTVEYNGIRNVKTLGKRISKISSQELQSIIFQFENYYFFTIRDSNQLSDQHHQQTTISVRLGDQYNKVKYVEEGDLAPSTLKHIVRIVEKITKVDQLSGTSN
jgi:hypothetical protein